MLSRFISSTLAKAQIVEFLGVHKKDGVTKEQLVSRLLTLIETDADEYTRLLNTFPLELAVGPTELEELLQCSRVERRRWVGEGKIPVLERRLFSKAGRHLLYPVHDRRVVHNISQDEVARWREEYQAQVLERRKEGASRAVERRKANLLTRQDFQHSFLCIVEEWRHKGSLELASAFQLAYWTVWASRWAKENHIRYLRGTKHAALYVARRDAWYRRKNEAIRTLARLPYARLSFYRPANADKRYLFLCEQHHQMKEEGYYYDLWDFFYEHLYIIKTCPHCVINEEKDFYALYHIAVASPLFPDTHFSFHMPYPVGRAWFPAPGKLPSVEHVEQDGLFRFGRALFATEKITHREKDVLRYFEKALNEARKLYALEGSSTLNDAQIYE